MRREQRFWMGLLAALALLANATGAVAATCTSRATGNWNAAATWTCVGVPAATVPGASDSAIIASPHVVTLTAGAGVTNLTVNSGSTLAAGSATLTVSGNIANSGTISTGTGAIYSTGNAAVISSTNGAFPGCRLFTSGTAPSIAAGSILNLSTTASIFAGRTPAGVTVAASVLTINGIVNGAGMTAGNSILRVYATNTLIGASGVINAASASIQVLAAATLTNNGSVTIMNMSGSNATTSIWTNAAGSTLNVSSALLATGVLNASAAGNTVNYNGAAAQAIKTPSAAGYTNLTLSGSLAKTAAANLLINGNLTLSGSATFAAGTSRTHTFLGNWIINTTAAAPFSFTTASTLNFNAPVTPTVTSIGGTSTATLAFNDVNINNTSGVGLNQNASFSTGTTPTLTVAAGATLTPTAAVIISGTGTLTGSGTVRVTRTTAGTANFNSQYTITTKTLTNLTVDYAGAAAQTVSVQTYGSATGGGLRVSNASGVSLTANTTVAGMLTLINGAVSTGAFTLITSRACNAPSVVRTGGHVAGFLQKNIPVGAPVNCTFEVGDTATYRPIDTTFVSVATAGNLVGSVSQAAGEHPQCCGATPFGLDSTKNVNRYWIITNPGGIAFTTYSTTFNFINPTDFDAGANPANFEVEFWNGAWNTTTFGTRTLTSTQASGLAAFGNFAVGEKKQTTPGSFNAFETSTAAGAITGVIKTRISGSAFSLDVVAISGGIQMNTFTNTVKIDLLGNTVTGVGLDGNNCPLTFTLVQTVSPNPPVTAGRSTASFAAVSDAWKDVRVRISFPALSPTVISCSTDNFAIRPNSLVLDNLTANTSVMDGNWQTAGSARTLNNSSATGGSVHKAGQPFTVSATARNAAGTTTANYTGSPTVKTIACTMPTPICINGTLTMGIWSGNGTVTTSTASYNEVGAFNLTIEDQIFAGVDSADSTLLERTIPQAGTVAVGRFVPDHFVMTTSNMPQFKTFNDTACGARTFTYIGQPFGYVTAPRAQVAAQNAAGATTANYSNNLWKIAAAAIVKDCTTNPDICTLTSGNVTQAYTYTTAPVATPNWDNSQVSVLAPSIAHPLNDGTGTITSNTADVLAFMRSLSTPQALFSANITLTGSVVDDSENAGVGNGIITTLTPAVFSGIAFDAGNEFRYGRLKLSNAHGSELLNLPVPIQAQYWNGATFVTNAADNCTTLAANNIKLTAPPAGVSATVGGAFSSGVGSLTLAKPATPAKVAVDMCVDLGADPVGGTVCSATASANLPYLQGPWPPGTSYNNDPAARATFGVYKGNDSFIYLRENY